MGLSEDLDARITGFLAGNYETWAPRGVPLPEDIRTGNHAAKLEATTLFIDVRQSSNITNAFRLQTAAKMMKCYFDGAVRIIRANHGEVRSFNGDGMLAIFVGDRRSNNAMDAAMKVEGFVKDKLQPRFAKYFSANSAGRVLGFSIGCGLDDGEIFAVRVGIRGTNDVAWVGRGTNASAKLASKVQWPTNIGVTRAVYSRLNKENRYASGGAHKWTEENMVLLGGVRRATRRTSWYRHI